MTLPDPSKNTSDNYLKTFTHEGNGRLLMRDVHSMDAQDSNIGATGRDLKGGRPLWQIDKYLTCLDSD